MSPNSSPQPSNPEEDTEYNPIDFLYIKPKISELKIFESEYDKRKKNKRRGKKAMIAAIITGTGIIAGAAGYFFNRGNDSQAAPAPEDTPSPAATAIAETPQPTDSQIQIDMPGDSDTSPDEGTQAGEQDSARLGYNYLDYLSFDEKTSRNAFGTSRDNCFNNDALTRSEFIKTAEDLPEALASYKNLFFEDEQRALGIYDMTEKQIDDYLGDLSDPKARELRDNMVKMLTAIVNDKENTTLQFYLQNGYEISHYIIWTDQNGDGVLTPAKAHLGTDNTTRVNAKQVDIYRKDRNGNLVKMLDLNLDCRFQPNYEYVVQTSYTDSIPEEEPEDPVQSEDEGQIGGGASEDDGQTGGGNETTDTGGQVGGGYTSKVIPEQTTPTGGQVGGGSRTLVTPPRIVVIDGGNSRDDRDPDPTPPPKPVEENKREDEKPPVQIAPKNADNAERIDNNADAFIAGQTGYHNVIPDSGSADNQETTPRETTERYNDMGFNQTKEEEAKSKEDKPAAMVKEGENGEANFQASTVRNDASRGNETTSGADTSDKQAAPTTLSGAVRYDRNDDVTGATDTAGISAGRNDAAEEPTSESAAASASTETPAESEAASEKPEVDVISTENVYYENRGPANEQTTPVNPNDSAQSYADTAEISYEEAVTPDNTTSNTASSTFDDVLADLGIF